MNGTTAALAEVEALIAGFSAPECEVLLRPPATPIARVTEVARGGVLKVGGQDCHA
jgi:triosephosphate isomerase (TIM)